MNLSTNVTAVSLVSPPPPSNTHEAIIMANNNETAKNDMTEMVQNGMVEDRTSPPNYLLSPSCSNTNTSSSTVTSSSGDSSSHTSSSSVEDETVGGSSDFIYSGQDLSIQQERMSPNGNVLFFDSGVKSSDSMNNNESPNGQPLNCMKNSMMKRNKLRKQHIPPPLDLTLTERTLQHVTSTTTKDSAGIQNSSHRIVSNSCDVPLSAPPLFQPQLLGDGHLRRKRAFEESDDTHSNGVKSPRTLESALVSSSNTFKPPVDHCSSLYNNPPSSATLFRSPSNISALFSSPQHPPHSLPTSATLPFSSLSINSPLCPTTPLIHSASFSGQQSTSKPSRGDVVHNNNNNTDDTTENVSQQTKDAISHLSSVLLAAYTKRLQDEQQATSNTSEEEDTSTGSSWGSSAAAALAAASILACKNKQSVLNSSDGPHIPNSPFAVNSPSLLPSYYQFSPLLTPQPFKTHKSEASSSFPSIDSPLSHCASATFPAQAHSFVFPSACAISDKRPITTSHSSLIANRSINSSQSSPHRHCRTIDVSARLSNRLTSCNSSGYLSGSSNNSLTNNLNNVVQQHSSVAQATRNEDEQDENIDVTDVTENYIQNQPSNFNPSWQCFESVCRVKFIIASLNTPWQSASDLGWKDKVAVEVDPNNAYKYAPNGLKLTNVDVLNANEITEDSFDSSGFQDDLKSTSDGVLHFLRLQFTPNQLHESDDIEEKTPSTSIVVHCHTKHPFYVDNKGWASFDSIASQEAYCTTFGTLDVGDVCSTTITFENQSVDFACEKVERQGSLEVGAKKKTSSSKKLLSKLSLSLNINKNNKSGSDVTSKKNEDQPKAKRPMNGFMLFAKKHRLQLIQKHPGKDNRAISVLLGEAWKSLSIEDRNQVSQKAKMMAEEQKKMHPDCWKRKKTCLNGPKNSTERKTQQTRKGGSLTLTNKAKQSITFPDKIDIGMNDTSANSSSALLSPFSPSPINGSSCSVASSSSNGLWNTVLNENSPLYSPVAAMSVFSRFARFMRPSPEMTSSPPTSAVSTSGDATSFPMPPISSPLLFPSPISPFLASFVFPPPQLSASIEGGNSHQVLSAFPFPNISITPTTHINGISHNSNPLMAGTSNLPASADPSFGMP